MEALLSWAGSLVTAMIVTMVVSFIAPDDESQKPIKLIIALFVLVSFFMPFSSAELPSLDEVKGFDEYVENSALEDSVENYAADLLSAQIVSSITAYLKNIGINSSDISVNIDIDDEKNISVKSITVKLNGSDLKKVSGLNEFCSENYGVKPIIKDNGG